MSGTAPAASTPPAVELEDVRFGYRPDAPVLEIARLRIERGERVFVFGPSGSGKTTLLGLLAGVLAAPQGRVAVLGHDLSRMRGARRDAFRAEHMGYIFQMFNLIPYLSVRENIALPCRLSRARLRRLGAIPLDAAIDALAARLEIGALLRAPVTELSVGQQQRVAAARALIGAPELVIADEPTSALDADLRERFVELLFESCAAAGATLVFVSHDRSLLPLFDRALSLPELNAVRPVRSAVPV